MFIFITLLTCITNDFNPRISLTCQETGETMWIKKSDIFDIKDFKYIGLDNKTYTGCKVNDILQIANSCKEIAK